MQCKRCGANLHEGTYYCSVCGEFNPTNPITNQPANNGYSFQQQMYNGQQYGQQQYNGYNQQMYNGQQFTPYNPNQPIDSGSIGWGILGFLFPFIGWILFFVWKNSKPNSARIAGIGGVIGFISNIIISLLNPEIFRF